MCTVGAISAGGKVLIFKSFDYPPCSAGWSYLQSFGDGFSKFALVNTKQPGINSGMNDGGLALAISRSPLTGEDGDELRTVLNAQILSRCSSVDDAVAAAEEFVADHPEMLAGNLVLADSTGVCVVEYAKGMLAHFRVQDGYLARANHFLLLPIKNATEDSLMRQEAMERLLERLYRSAAELQPCEMASTGISVLRTAPILNDQTRSSFVIDVVSREIRYILGSGSVQAFSFRDAGR